MSNGDQLLKLNFRQISIFILHASPHSVSLPFMQILLSKIKIYAAEEHHGIMGQNLMKDKMQ